MCYQMNSSRKTIHKKWLQSFYAAFFFFFHTVATCWKWNIFLNGCVPYCNIARSKQEYKLHTTLYFIFFFCDQDMSLNAYIKRICRTAFFHLCNVYIKSLFTLGWCWKNSFLRLSYYFSDGLVFFSSWLICIINLS